MTKIIKPLLRRRSLLPGESAPISLLTRLAALNYYDSLTVFKSSYGKDHIVFPESIDTWEFLEQITQISAIDLYKASPHYFAPILMHSTDRDKSVNLQDGAVLPLLKFSAKVKYLWLKKAQFCPLCLDEGAYHRLAWMPKAVTVCLRHRNLLLDRCPACKENLRLENVVERQCKRCGADLRKAKTFSVINDDFGFLSQQIIQSWLGLVSTPDNPLSSTMPPLPPSSLYSMLRSLKLILQRTKDLDYIHKSKAPSFYGRNISEFSTKVLTPEQSYILYATALKGLSEWPDGFISLVDEYIRYNFRTGKIKGVHIAFLKKAIQRSLPSSEKQFVDEAFQKYIFSPLNIFYGATMQSNILNTDPRLQANLHDRLFYISHSDAARILGVKPAVLVYLKNAGLLASFTGYGQSQSMIESDDNLKKLLSRKEVKELSLRKADLITPEETKLWLGLSTEVIEELIDAGLLKAEQTNTGGKCSSGQPSIGAVLNLIDQLLSQSQMIQSPVSARINLSTAATIFSKKGVNSAQILKYVITGEIPCFASEELAQLNDLIFNPNYIRAYLGIGENRKDLIHLKEIIQRMGVSADIANHWIDTGLLKPAIVLGSIKYISQNNLDVFVKKYILDYVAARSLKISQNAIHSYIADGTLTPVLTSNFWWGSRHLLCREEVERLRQAFAQKDAFLLEYLPRIN